MVEEEEHENPWEAVRQGETQLFDKPAAQLANVVLHRVMCAVQQVRDMCTSLSSDPNPNRERNLKHHQRHHHHSYIAFVIITFFNSFRPRVYIVEAQLSLCTDVDSRYYPSLNLVLCILVVTAHFLSPSNKQE